VHGFFEAVGSQCRRYKIIIVAPSFMGAVKG